MVVKVLLLICKETESLQIAFSAFPKFNHNLAKAFLRCTVFLFVFYTLLTIRIELREPRGMDFDISLWLSLSKNIKGFKSVFGKSLNQKPFQF